MKKYSFKLITHSFSDWNFVFTILTADSSCWFFLFQRSCFIVNKWSTLNKNIFWFFESIKVYLGYFLVMLCSLWLLSCSAAVAINRQNIIKSKNWNTSNIIFEPLSIREIFLQCVMFEYSFSQNCKLFTIHHLSMLKYRISQVTLRSQ